MSNKKNITKPIVESIGADANAPSSITPIAKYEPTDFEKEIKGFFGKDKNMELKRIENLGGSTHEQYDIDVEVGIAEMSEDQHIEKRNAGAAAVHQLKQDFYNHLHTKGFNVSTMSPRGVRVNGNKIETTISLTLSNVPKVHREERVRKLIQGVVSEVIQEDAVAVVKAK